MTLDLFFCAHQSIVYEQGLGSQWVVHIQDSKNKEPTWPFEELGDPKVNYPNVAVWEPIADGDVLTIC